MREGVLRAAVSIPLEANGQTSWLIDAKFPAADTSDFVGSVRYAATGGGSVLHRGPGNGSRHPHLYRAAGGAGPGEDGSGIERRAVVSLFCLTGMGE